MVWSWALVFIGLCWSVVGQSIPQVGTQSVVLDLPEEFHVDELAAVLQQFVNAEADIYISSVHTVSDADVAALRALIPSRFFNLQPGLSGGPRVTVIPVGEQLTRDFDKAVFLGGGWYDEYFKPSGYRESTQPDYADELYGWVRRMVTQQAVIGAIGAGIYPLVYSDILLPGAWVPAYPCSDLITVITRQGYTPFEHQTTPRSDGAWPPLVSAKAYVGDEVAVEGARVVITAIPNSWYDTTATHGALLVDDYQWEYVNTVAVLENTHLHLVHPTAVEIRQIECAEDGFIVVTNTDDTAVDLTGWQLHSVDPTTGEVLYTYTFDDYVLEGGADVMIVVGTPSQNPEHLNWTTANVWSVGGAKVVLVDPQGNQRAVRAETQSD